MESEEEKMNNVENDQHFLNNIKQTTQCSSKMKNWTTNLDGCLDTPKFGSRTPESDSNTKRKKSDPKLQYSDKEKRTDKELSSEKNRSRVKLKTDSGTPEIKPRTTRNIDVKQLVNKDFEYFEKVIQEKNEELEKCELERVRLVTDLLKCNSQNTALRRALENDRDERKDMETKALKFIKQNKLKYEQDACSTIGRLQAEIEQLNDKLTESHTVNNELSSKYDRAENDLKIARNEVDRLNTLEAIYKDKMSKARQQKRQSIAGVESRLEQIAADSQQQESILQQKLTQETKNRMQVSDKLKDLEVSNTLMEMKLQAEIKGYTMKIEELEMKIKSQDRQIVELEGCLSLIPNLEALEAKLMMEQEENEKLMRCIHDMKIELHNTTRSFMEHENVIADNEEHVAALERELKQITEEKIEVERRLQEVKDREEDNKHKMNSLELIFKRLEQGVIKLEAENTKLRQQVSVTTTSVQLSSEEETKYQQKISFLEDQVAKLEGQLEKLKEKVVVDREQYKTIQSSLWKNEKELSGTKIDLRIAKRELKTAEETIKKHEEDQCKLKERLREEAAKRKEEVSKETEKCTKLEEASRNMAGELKEKVTHVEKLTAELNKMEQWRSECAHAKRNMKDVEQKCKVLEDKVAELKKEREIARDTCQKLELEKCKLESSLEESKRQISSLELNLNVLKETTSMLDEQLEDYDKFTTNQNKKIEQLQADKGEVDEKLETAQNDVKSARQLLNEEKSFRLKAEQRVRFLENEVQVKEESSEELQKQYVDVKNEVLCLKQQVAEYEDMLTKLQNDVKERQRSIESLSMDARLTNEHLCSLRSQIYTLKETNCKLTRELEDEQSLSDALQDRVDEMENIVRELENFHRQREVKDEATKQQQNKLITFLQTKLNDCKKKKTLTDKLFGSRSKENTPPVLPTSNHDQQLHQATPLKERSISGKALSEQHVKQKLQLQKTPRSTTAAAAVRSPRSNTSNSEVLSQIVKSPSSQLTKSSSIKRMHHNIPHRFKLKPTVRQVKCQGCYSMIERGNQMSACVHCTVQCHPKCSHTIPKTCGLPNEFVRHYQSAVSSGNNRSADNLPAKHEGWIKVLRQGKGTWERKYMRLDEKELLFYEHEPRDNVMRPVFKIDMCPVDGSNIIVGEIVDDGELPTVARTDLKFVIKLCVTPNTTCWPTDTYYLMASTNNEKMSWLSTLNSTVTNSRGQLSQDTQSLSSYDKYRGETVYSCSAVQDVHEVNTLVQLTDKVLLLCTSTGLYSVKLSQEISNNKVHIKGPDCVHDLATSSQINVAVMIVGAGRRLVQCDLRSLISNSEAAQCSQPEVRTATVNLDCGGQHARNDSCILSSLSTLEHVDGNVYLSAATSSNFVLLKWKVSESAFVPVKTLRTASPTTCVLYTAQHIIIGHDRFVKISVNGYNVEDLVDPKNRALAYWRANSFPMNIVQVEKDEYLLCYNEFGVFVDQRGERTRHDLKWSSFPCYFAYRKPYLFVFHFSSVEIVRLLPRPEPLAVDDTASIASTATLRDTSCLSYNKPKFLGFSTACKTGVYLSTVNNNNNTDIIMLDASKACKEDIAGSCYTLSTIPDREADEFSFTSSIVQALDDKNEAEMSETESSECCATYTLSSTENKQSKKNVSFVQHTAM